MPPSQLAYHNMHYHSLAKFLFFSSSLHSFTVPNPSNFQSSNLDFYANSQLLKKPISPTLTKIQKEKKERKNKKKAHLACNNASRISTSLAPFLTAPLTCVPSSIHFPSAVSITRLSRLLSRSESPGRVQIVAQADSYLGSCGLVVLVRTSWCLGWVVFIVVWGIGVGAEGRRWDWDRGWDVEKRVVGRGNERQTVANCCSGLMKSLPPFSSAFATYSSPTTFFLISSPCA